MSSDLAFPQNRRPPGQPLFRFLGGGGRGILCGDPARFLRPLVDFLREFHASGQAHGAVMPGRLLISPEGVWDLEFFRIRAGSPDPLELEVYYPDGPGGTPEERQRRDVRALAAVLHVIVTDHPPARRSWRVPRLAEHPLARDWPAELTAWADRVLDAEPQGSFPGLEELAAALAPAAGPAPVPELPPSPERQETRETTGTVEPEGSTERHGDAEEQDGAMVSNSGQVVNNRGETVNNPAAVLPECRNAGRTDLPKAPVRPVPVGAAGSGEVTGGQNVRPPAVSVRLPNGMAGRAFAVELVSLAELAAVPEDWFEIPGGLPAGLHFSGGLLSGTPSQAGEFEISLGASDPSRRSAASGLSAPSAGSGSDVDSGSDMGSDSGSGFPFTLLLTVNPDPRSLWKNLPSDPAGKFAKPDTATGFLPAAGDRTGAGGGCPDSFSAFPPDAPPAAAAGPAGPLAVLGASLRGRSHAHVGAFRDDDLSMAWFPEHGWHVLTVADGAGSARFSREGSRVVCETVTACFAGKSGGGPDGFLTELAEHHAADPDDPEAERTLREELSWRFGFAALQARRALEALAAEHQAALRDFHTTLITVLLHPLADGRWFAAAFSIGDGAAAVIGAPGGAPCLLTRADSGDYAGQTVFLTMDPALTTPEAVAARVRTAVLPAFEAVLLVTDGISDPWFPSDTALADPGGWSRLWGEIRPVLARQDTRRAQAEALLDWMGFHSPGHHDDRTVVLAAPPSSLTPPPAA